MEATEPRIYCSKIKIITNTGAEEMLLNLNEKVTMGRSI
jgi:hypothetical protein